MATPPTNIEFIYYWCQILIAKTICSTYNEFKDDRSHLKSNWKSFKSWSNILQKKNNSKEYKNVKWERCVQTTGKTKLEKHVTEKRYTRQQRNNTKPKVEANSENGLADIDTTSRKNLEQKGFHFPFISFSFVFISFHDHSLPFISDVFLFISNGFLRFSLTFFISFSLVSCHYFSFSFHVPFLFVHCPFIFLPFSFCFLFMSFRLVQCSFISFDFLSCPCSSLHFLLSLFMSFQFISFHFLSFSLVAVDFVYRHFPRISLFLAFLSIFSDRKRTNCSTKTSVETNHTQTQPA